MRRALYENDVTIDAVAGRRGQAALFEEGAR